MRSAIFYNEDTLEMFQTIVLNNEIVFIYLKPDNSTALKYLNPGSFFELVKNAKLKFLGHV